MVLLSNGDCTKREAVLWGIQLSDAEPYLHRCLERRLADQIILSVAGVKLPWLKGPQADELPDNQAIGEACGGKLVDRCTTVFQDKLYIACRSCPGLN